MTAPLRLAIAMLVATIGVGLMRSYLQVPVHKQWTPLLQSIRALQGPEDVVAFRPGWVAGAAGDLGRTRRLNVSAAPPLTDELPAGAQLWLLDWGMGTPPAARTPLAQAIPLGPGGTLWRIPQTAGPARDLMSLHLSEARLRGLAPDGSVAWERAGTRLRAPGAGRRQAVMAGRPGCGGPKRTAIQLRPGSREVRELSIPALALSEELVLLAGVADPRSGGRAQGPPVSVELWLDGVRQSALEVHPERGWQQQLVPLDIQEGHAELAVRVSGASDTPLWVQVETRPAPIRQP